MTKTEILKRELLDYLYNEKNIIQQLIEKHKSLCDEDKIESGILVKSINCKEIAENTYEFCVSENYTKWRTGDRVSLLNSDSSIRISAIIVDNLPESIVVTTEKALKENISIDIIYEEAIFTDIIIDLLESAEKREELTFFLEVLSGEIPPPTKGLNQIVCHQEDMDEEKSEAIDKILCKPYVYCLQGPPGTGKTKVLSRIASIFSQKGKDVLILALTHQAVNNALNAVAFHKKLPVVKIGELLKGMGLHEHIVQKKDFKTFSKSGKKHRYSKGHVVGMTLNSAIVNFGLKRTGFSPSIVLIDEASQIPLSTSSVLGIIGSSSYIFFGDERQMPPIFQPELVKSFLSVSIFDYLKTNIIDELKMTLHTTYRMNSVICDYVSRNFYEPYGIKLSSFVEISNRKVDGEDLNESIEHIVIESENSTDFNEAEAQKAVEVAITYKELGEDVAIITPFRKQVNLIRKVWNEKTNDRNILIDTVERLQGQDVDVIILSTSVNSWEYYQTTNAFIENANRLNVIFSRAKKKVVAITSPLVKLPQ